MNLSIYHCISFLSIDVSKIFLLSFKVKERRIYFSIKSMTLKYSLELQSFMKRNKQNRISFNNQNASIELGKWELKFDLRLPVNKPLSQSQNGVGITPFIEAKGPYYIRWPSYTFNTMVLAVLSVLPNPNLLSGYLLSQSFV